MKISNISKPGLLWLVLGLHLSTVQPIRADITNTAASQTPIFQFAAFYNDLMEFTWAAPLVIKGRVHCNTNIYVGSSSDLTFSNTVTTVGIVTNPSWGGFSNSLYTGAVIYEGSPGYLMHQPTLTLPIGANGNDANALRQIIYPPPVGESVTNLISSQRYYNKAFMVITVSNTMVTLAIKNSTYDSSPLIFSNGPAGSLASTNWTNNTKWNIDSWLTTNITFYDDRENRTNHCVQIDVAALGTWIGNIGGATNTYLTSNKWSTTTPFNGVIYVADWRDTNSHWMNCVRLTNGVNITNGLYASGLTVATPNPLYIVGNYNCPNASFLGTTNTTQSRPCSVACDALTLLSGAWADSKSALGFGSRNNAPATTVNAAILAGIVYSAGSGNTQYSGGVPNLPRLLENWSSVVLTLNSSMVCLFNSVQATTQFVLPGTYYNAPSTRHLWFDQNFNDPAQMPPGTPMVGKLAASISITNLSQGYDGTPRNVSVVTVPQNLPVDVTYNGSTNPPISQGSYTVTATINDAVYMGSATNVLTIGPGAAVVTLSNLLQVYDGAAKSASVTSVPQGLAVDVTYDGLTNAPTNSGSYVVVGTVNDANYQGMATNTLIISTPATLPIGPGSLTPSLDGRFEFAFTNAPGAHFSVLASADPAQAFTNWTLLGSMTEVSPGQFQFTDAQATNSPQRFYIIRSP